MMKPLESRQRFGTRMALLDHKIDQHPDVAKLNGMLVICNFFDGHTKDEITWIISAKSVKYAKISLTFRRVDLKIIYNDV